MHTLEQEAYFQTSKILMSIIQCAFDVIDSIASSHIGFFYTLNSLRILLSKIKTENKSEAKKGTKLYTKSCIEQKKMHSF